MKAKRILCLTCAVAAIPLFAARGDVSEPVLPGSEGTVKEALPLSDLIAVAQLVKFGRGALGMPGYVVFHDTSFKVIRLIKGKANAKITAELFVLDQGQEAPREMVDYIVLFYIRSDGRRAVGKMLLDNKKNEKEISSLMASH